MDDPQLLLEIGRMDDQGIVTLIMHLRQERDRLQVDLHGIARYVMKNQDAIREGNGMMELARMLDAALDGGKAE